MTTSLELAITAIRSGRKEEGRQLLNLLIQQNPNNEQAWLWMSSVVNNDEQRARCLYHVLAINPNNEIARRGLQVLGIVVSDSRPVKVPRDSQPIRIPNPSVPDQPPSVEERRPFRIDSKAMTEELPFTPLKKPLTERLRRSPSAFIPRPNIGKPASGTAQSAPESESVIRSNAVTEIKLPSQSTEAGQTEVGPQFKPGTGPLPNLPGQSPSPANTGTPPEAGSVSPLPDTLAQPYYGGPNLPHETRPAPPIWTPHPNTPANMPQPDPNSQLPYPTPPMPGLHSNLTMGMPTHYLQPQNAPAPMPSPYSNTTMGMPVQAQNVPYPVGPNPAMHSNATMGMTPYGQPAFQPLMPQNPAFHSGATMSMPTLTEAEARARMLANPSLPPQSDPFAVNQAGRSPKGAKKEQKEEDEVNILAVIVFGSLSVTALGGLGMLILLMFTGGQ